MKYLKILLMEHKEKLEGVGLSYTEKLTPEDFALLIKGAHPILPISQIKDYAKEVKDYSKVMLFLDSNFKQKDIQKAQKYCEKKQIQFEILTD